MAGNKVPELVHGLCHHLLGKNAAESDVSSVCTHSLSLLESRFTPSDLSNEFKVTERIKKKLFRMKRESDALAFSELSRRLSSKSVLQNKWAVLKLLLLLCEDHNFKQSSSSFLRDPLCVSSNLSIPQSSFKRPSVIGARSTNESVTILPRQPVGVESSFSTHNITGTSGIGSMGAGSVAGSFTSQSTDRRQPHSSTPHQDPPISREAWTGRSDNTVVDERTLPKQTLPQEDKLGNPLVLPYEESVNTSHEISEAVLVRDIIFTFQGIDGKYICFDKTEDAYRVDPKVGVPRSVRELCHKLGELGWLFRKVRTYTENKRHEKSSGLVVQSFCSALSNQLSEYYRLVAVLEGQQPLSGLIQGNPLASLTLKKLAVWTYDPLQRLKTLAILVDKAKGVKGGTLLSMLYSFTHHGNPSVRTLVKQLLTDAYRPINFMMNKWLLEGEMNDSFHEFYISSDVDVPLDRLWQSKYAIRKSMLPSFIAMETAKKILITGKSINFLRLRCQDRTDVGSVFAKEWMTGDGSDESTFDRMTGPKLLQTVDKVYRETSKYLLEILNRKYMFLDHLKGTRRYLLLGQGDFIQHLMDLLEPELVKSADYLFVHNLTGMMESAIRSTNAQYENADILQRLDVRLLEISPGDCGWDVFSLDYHVDGPINTVFTPEIMLKYLRVFNFLWRAKRIEFTLAKLWTNQFANSKALQSIRELQPLLHLINTLSASMVHFINQMQYYITFEVLECSWAILQKDVSAAPDLDEVIAAHSKFLSDITTRCLLDANSQVLLTQLRTILNLIVDMQHKQDLIFSQCFQELDRRKKLEELSKEREKLKEWGTSDREAENELSLKRQFNKSLSAFKSQIMTLQMAYDGQINGFLTKLAHQQDENLRFLAMRLNFNDHYSSAQSL